jgi:hypothetical protein
VPPNLVVRFVRAYDRGRPVVGNAADMDFAAPAPDRADRAGLAKRATVRRLLAHTSGRDGGVGQ